MIIATVVILAALAILFALLFDGGWGLVFLLALFGWVWGMQPANATEPLPTDTDWPSISEPSQPVLFSHNVVGDRIVLFANFCAGDAARRDHMHTYGVYDSHNQFIQGGCWKFDPAGTRKTKTIEYFDMGATGWDKWPLLAFKPVKALNVTCRGNSGDDPKTWQACHERDGAQFN